LQEIFRQKVSLWLEARGGTGEPEYPTRHSHGAGDGWDVEGCSHGAGQDALLGETTKWLLLLSSTSNGSRISWVGWWGPFPLLPLLLSSPHKQVSASTFSWASLPGAAKGKVESRDRGWLLSEKKKFWSYFEFCRNKYFGFVATRKKRATFGLRRRVCVAPGGRRASAAYRGCTQPCGCCRTWCLPLAPMMPCRSWWGFAAAPQRDHGREMGSRDSSWGAFG